MPPGRGSLALIALLVGGQPVAAQVVYDGSLGPPGAAPTRSDLPGFDLDYLVTYDESLPDTVRHGVRIGNNLFQSLSEFSVLRPAGSRTSASFQALDGAGGPLALSNLIVRVTGGEPSRIEGVLRSEVPGADVYLLNPAGVLFQGSGALESQLDVPASLYVATADGLRFEDGSLFEVDDLASPTLSAADPTAFGFLGGNPAGITIDASLPFGTVSGATLTLAAGHVTLSNESILSAASGVAQVAAVGDAAAEVPLDVQNWAVADAPTGALGTIEVVGDSALLTAGASASDPQGRIVLRGGRLVIDDSRVSSGGNAGPAQLALDVEIADEVIVRNDSRLQVSTDAAAGAGGGRLSTRRLEVRDDITRVGVRTQGAAAAAAPFVIQADEILVADGGLLTTENRQLAPGGELIVLAETLEVRDGGRIEGATVLGNGQGGDLRIATDRLLVTRTPGSDRTGEIRTISVNGGDSGDIRITANDIVVEEESQVASLSGSRGDGGDITIATGSLRLASGGQIRTTTETDRDAGRLNIDATGAVEIAGDGGDPAIPSGLFARSGSATGAGAGDGGALTLTAGSLHLSGNAAISTRSFGSGAAGALTIGRDADPVEVVSLEGDANGTPEIATRSVDGGGEALSVHAGRLELLGGGALASSTFGSGNAGAIEVTADSVLLSGRDASGDESALLSETTSPDIDAGDGGAIRIVASGGVELLAGGLVSAKSRGPGDAGSVEIDAGGDVHLANGRVETQSPGSAGGNIAIASDRELLLVDSAVTASVLGRAGEGDAGNVTLVAPFVVLNHSAVLATAMLGDGGDIRIGANAFLESTDSEVNASSDLGIDGVIAKPAPDTTLIGGLARLPASFLDATALLRQHCAARASGSGSFVVAGRDGPAASPTRPLSATMPLPEGSGDALLPVVPLADRLALHPAIDCAAFEGAAP